MSPPQATDTTRIEQLEAKVDEINRVLAMLFAFVKPPGLDDEMKDEILKAGAG